jgi:serpin B
MKIDRVDVRPCRNRRMEGMTRFQRKLWIVSCCVAVVMLPVAAGSLLGALLGVLLAAMQSRPMTLVSEDSVAALTEAYNASGQELFARLRAAPGNIIVSPYSIGTVMALTLSGAAGDTEAEMARVLRHRLSQAEIDSANGKALAILDRYGEAATLHSANAVMLPRDHGAISTGYLSRARASYAAEIFAHANPADINNWVSWKTAGRIDKIIDRLDPDAAAVVLNAAYFKAPWFDPFDKARTQAKPFALSPSQTVQVPMMHREGIFPVATGAGFSAIRVPYQARGLHMVIVLPADAGALPALSARLDGAALAELLSGFNGDSFAHVDLGLPRFKARFEVSLRDHFRALGMTQPFDRARADFSGITAGSARLFIQDVAHMAVIDVTEEGTEAAAATADAMAIGRPQPFHVDRPFLFYVVESRTNAILFQGRIVDPR